MGLTLEESQGLRRELQEEQKQLIFSMLVVEREDPTRCTEQGERCWIDIRIEKVYMKILSGF